MQLRKIYRDLHDEDGWNSLAAGTFAFVVWPTWSILCSAIITVAVVTLHTTVRVVNVVSLDPKPIRPLGSELRVIWRDTWT